MRKTLAEKQAAMKARWGSGNKEHIVQTVSRGGEGYQNKGASENRAGQQIEVTRKVIDDIPFDQKLRQEVTDVATWPHAEQAAQLARERHPNNFIEIEPNLFMCGVTIKDEQLVRILDVCYVERMPHGTFTLWGGKRLTYQRPYPSSGKWSLQSVEPLERERGDSLTFDLKDKILRYWAWHEWNGKTDDFPYGQKRKLALPAKPMITADMLSTAATPAVEDLVRSCSRILTARRRDEMLFEYKWTEELTTAHPSTRISQRRLRAARSRGSASSRRSLALKGGYKWLMCTLNHIRGNLLRQVDQRLC